MQGVHSQTFKTMGGSQFSYLEQIYERKWRTWSCIYIVAKIHVQLIEVPHEVEVILEELKDITLEEIPNASMVYLL